MPAGSSISHGAAPFLPVGRACRLRRVHFLRPSARGSPPASLRLLPRAVSGVPSPPSPARALPFRRSVAAAAFVWLVLSPLVFRRPVLPEVLGALAPGAVAPRGCPAPRFRMAPGCAPPRVFLAASQPRRVRMTRAAGSLFAPPGARFAPCQSPPPVPPRPGDSLPARPCVGGALLPYIFSGASAPAGSSILHEAAPFLPVGRA